MSIINFKDENLIKLKTKSDESEKKLITVINNHLSKFKNCLNHLKLNYHCENEHDHKANKEIRLQEDMSLGSISIKELNGSYCISGELNYQHYGDNIEVDKISEILPILNPLIEDVFEASEPYNQLRHEKLNHQKNLINNTIENINEISKLYREKGNFLTLLEEQSDPQEINTENEHIKSTITQNDYWPNVMVGEISVDLNEGVSIVLKYSSCGKVDGMTISKNSEELFNVNISDNDHNLYIESDQGSTFEENLILMHNMTAQIKDDLYGSYINIKSKSKITI